ncbi:hypothetical protein HYX70_03685 [Candidatus Saccharibacteria bacterium]|nr:hypothetical protein [Candidatus Saccharibacteria bacterium]
MVVLAGQYSHPTVESILDEHPGQEALGPRRVRQHQRRLTPAEIDLLVASYKSGSTLVQLAEEFGINRATARAHLERRGVARRETAQALTADEVKIIAEMYEQRVPTEVIAGEFGVHAATIRRALKRVSVELRR